jgi:pimeloyl-ACP methyl ester carboxylesterase
MERLVRKKYAVAGIVLSATLLAGGLTASVPALASSSCGGSGSVTKVTGKLPDGAKYKIECPGGTWNGTLLLYSHGYVTPGSPNPATDVGDPLTGAALLGQGFALAGSSYASTGWAIQQAIPDQIATLNVFGTMFTKPTRTIAWGHSLGGIITAGLIQTHPKMFAGALPMCGVLSGGVATWNTALDGAFAFKHLVAPAVKLVHITDPNGNLAAAEQAVAKAQKTRKGRARLALGAALSDTPGWFTPLSKQPAPSDFKGQEHNQYLWESQVDFPFAFALRAELEARAGGNPSWNTGVNYFKDLSKSADLREVRALYHAAGLSLHSDVSKLNRASRIRADKAALTYLKQNITFNGNIQVPVLTLHTVGDGLVVPENEQAYRSVVDRAGKGALLRERFVHRAGHCAFTPAETLTAMQVLLNRLNTGSWHDSAIGSAALNSQAAALGPALNVFVSPVTGKPVPTAPAFVHYVPPPYLRPFDRRGAS